MQIQRGFLLLLLLLLFQSEMIFSGWWTWSSSKTETISPSSKSSQVVRHPAAFDIESPAVLKGGKGSKLIEEASQRKGGCWQEAYTSLFSNCRDILRNEDQKFRMAYQFTNCFLASSGKPTLKPCPPERPVKECTKSLTEHNHQILLNFFLDTASMCHYIQSETFKMETEELVIDLKNSANWVEARLHVMQNQAESILQQSDKIVGMQKKLQEEYTTMEDSIEEMQQTIDQGLSSLKGYAEQASKQLSDVTTTQKDLLEQQEKLNYQQQVLTGNLEKDMLALMSRASDIDTTVKQSLTGQEQLLAGQDLAMSSLQTLHQLQLSALEESRSSLQDLSNQARLHQQQFRAWQSDLEQIHHKLAEGSSSILHAQEEFGTKQAAVFSSLERLFALHRAILLEARVIRSFFFYVPISIFIYMITGARQTHGARAFLYFGLCTCFAVEFYFIRLRRIDLLKRDDYASKSFWTRTTFTLIGALYLIYMAFTFKDYSSLSYQILLDIQRMIQRDRDPYYQLLHNHPLQDKFNGCPQYLESEYTHEDEQNDPDYYPSQSSSSSSDHYTEDENISAEEDHGCYDLRPGPRISRERSWSSMLASMNRPGRFASSFF